MMPEEGAPQLRVLGLINARGGSKGIPRKNVRSFLGKPLITWSIEAGLAAKGITRVLVSSDDEEIIATAKAAGADAPFVRPLELAEDKALQIDAIIHALTWLEQEEGECYDAVCVLQPTSPGRNAADVDAAIDRYVVSGADSLISVTEVGGNHPLRIYRELSDGKITPLIAASQAGTLRQDLERFIWRNGAIFIINTQIALSRRSLYGDSLFSYEMPTHRSFDLDEPIDWAIGETMMSWNL